MISRSSAILKDAHYTKIGITNSFLNLEVANDKIPDRTVIRYTSSEANAILIRIGDDNKKCGIKELGG